MAVLKEVHYAYLKHWRVSQLDKGFFLTCKQEISMKGLLNLLSNILSIDEYMQVNLFYLSISLGYGSFQDNGYFQIEINANYDFCTDWVTVTSKSSSATPHSKQLPI